MQVAQPSGVDNRARFGELEGHGQERNGGEAEARQTTSREREQDRDREQRTEPRDPHGRTARGGAEPMPVPRSRR